MNVIQRCKREASLAVTEYISTLQQENIQPNSQYHSLSQKQIFTSLSQTESNNIEDQEQKYQHQQFSYFSSLNTVKGKKCVVCKKANPKYRCPKCKVTYCSGQHYKCHNLFCTEKFFQQQVECQLKATKASQNQRGNMVEMLKRNREQMQKDEDYLREQVKIKEIEEQRLVKMLQMLEKDEEVELTQTEKSCFQSYVNLISFSEEEKVVMSGQEGSLSNNFQQYVPFWLVEDGLSLYLVQNQIQVEYYNSCRHQELIAYRHLSSQLLRNELPRMLSNISFKNTSIFVNIELLQMIYLAVLLFRSFNGQYLNNNDFHTTFIAVYNQNIGKQVAETTTKKQQLRAGWVSLIKARIILLEVDRKQIYDILHPWTKMVLQDCSKILKGKYICLQTLFRLLQIFRSRQQHPPQWSDQIMQKSSSFKKIKRQKQVSRLVKKLQFLLCYVNQVAYRHSQITTTENIRKYDNRSILAQCLQQQMEIQEEAEAGREEVNERLQQQKQRKLNDILIP